MNSLIELSLSTGQGIVQLSWSVEIMKNKFLIMGLLACLFAPILSACNYGESEDNESGLMGMEINYLVYRSISEIAEVATNVIRGEVLDERVELRNTALSREIMIEEFGGDLSEEEMFRLFPDYLGEELGWLTPESEPHYEIVTIHRIKILEVFQGNYQVGDVVEVMQSGGIYENTAVSNSDLITFEPGEDLVFFIHSWSHIGRPTVLLNPFQSVYRFPTLDENAGSLDLDVELENVYGDVHFNNLTITLNDLLQLAKDQH